MNSLYGLYIHIVHICVYISVLASRMKLVICVPQQFRTEDGKTTLQLKRKGCFMLQHVLIRLEVGIGLLILLDLNGRGHERIESAF